MRILSFISVLSTFSFPLLAQDFNLANRFELAGTVGYNYTSSNFTGGSDKIHSISFQPSMGYFLTSEFQLILGPTISAYFDKLSRGGTIYISGIPLVFPMQEFKSESYNFGIRTGIAYHVLLDSRFVPYASITGALAWQRYVGAPPPLLNQWTKPTIIAPTVDIGLKIFLLPDWLLITRLSYARTLQQYSGDSKSDSYMILFGTGMAVLL